MSGDVNARLGGTLAMVGLLVALLTGQVQAQSPSWVLGVGQLEQRCSLVAVRSTLVVTASHCVGTVGETYSVSFVRGVGREHRQATLVWDGALFGDRTTDLALLALDRPITSVVRLASALPKKGDGGTAVGFSSGVRHWTVPVEFTGLFEVDELGWMLGYRAETTGGASGGGVFNGRGELVAIENIALREFRTLSFGVPVGRIRQALRDYDRHGPMGDRI
ncbi:MAG: trypsin-like serine peptidase [bacterium]